MNRHDRRKAAAGRKGSMRCSSCGRTSEHGDTRVKGSDGKLRCPICDGLHTKSRQDDLDPGDALPARMQKAIQQAILDVAGDADAAGKRLGKDAAAGKAT